MLEFFNELRSAISVESKDAEHAWIGVSAPAASNHVTVNLYAHPGFRSSDSNAKRFDSVWLVERAVSEQGWRILIDSAVRLLGSSGTLIIRYIQNQYISIPALKNFLFRKYGIEVSVIAERQFGGDFVTAFHVIRQAHILHNDKTWTFGILTQGKKPELVAKLCESIRQFGGEKHEIIIVGPQNEAYAASRPIYIDKQYSTQFADICIKKNDIVQLASAENLCILHDRYWLESDFFSGFEKFGYDFDFLTIRQQHESGKNYPSYCAINDRGHLIWGDIYECGNENQTWNRHYLNGGLIIAKTALLKAIPFNALIFHNQAEDVELSRQLDLYSIVPRINRLSTATTDVPDHLTNAFKISNVSDYDAVYFPSQPPVATAHPQHEMGQWPQNDVNPRPWGRLQERINRIERRRRNGASWKGIAYLSMVAVRRAIVRRTLLLASRLKDVFPDMSTDAPPASAPDRRLGVNLLMHAGDAGGVVNVSVHYARSLRRQNVPVCIVDIDRGVLPSVLPPDLLDCVQAAPVYPTNVWCVGFPFINRHLSRERAWSKGRWNANFTHWELPRIPHRLVAEFDQADSFIVDSEFVFDALRGATNKLIELVDPEVRVASSVTAPFDKDYFGLPKDKILFLLNWEYTSSTERKNPRAGLTAFFDAFGKASSEAALVMHVKYEQRRGEEWRERYEQFLLEIRREFPDVIVLDKSSYTYEEALGLKAACDCFISLHRSEGYGMSCAEALSMDRYCVMTGWSGNMELMKNAEWAKRAFTVSATLIPVSAQEFPWVEDNDEVFQLWADVRHGDAVRKIQLAYKTIKTQRALAA